MNFSVIYTIDCARGVRLKSFYPHNMRPWQITEDNDQGDYDDYFTKGSSHRKLVAWLTKAQFIKFLQDTNLYPDDVETMGSLGAPGLGYGISPAISFSCENTDYDCDLYGYIQTAYVTPVPCYPDGKPLREQGMDNDDWDRVRAVVMNAFR